MTINSNYDLGFTINSTAIPDPSGYDYEVADLDVSAERDATGLLHRDRVATKHNVSIKYDAIDWATIGTIMTALEGASFTLVVPIPGTSATYSGTYYCGNRKTSAIMLAGTGNLNAGSLSFSAIEY